MNIVDYLKKVSASRFGYLAHGCLATITLLLGIMLMTAFDSNRDFAEINWQLIFFISVMLGAAVAFDSWLLNRNRKLKGYRNRHRLF